MARLYCCRSEHITWEAYDQGYQVMCGTYSGTLCIWLDEKQLLELYPSLSEDSLRAVLSYLIDCVQKEMYFPLSV